MYIAGWSSCKYYIRAVNALRGVLAIFPGKFELNVLEFASHEEYDVWLPANRDLIGAPHHETSPLIWFENGSVVGGCDDTIAWIKKLFSPVEFSPKVSSPTVDTWNKDHTYDYDLVVIGGGSGGLACSKEAIKVNGDLKVAVLDFVKPSPQGSKWGLGGTCVNVGCIPKKLMHTAALMQGYSRDAAAYGWEGGLQKHSWESLRAHVQDHIGGLNFGYRVSLRENGITYLNKLGKFVDGHTLETTDAKGVKKNITSARFVVAVGGRPSPLNCPGGELAITSDDVFSKATSPGKTCVVGAGYVALECAGFIAGLKKHESHEKCCDEDHEVNEVNLQGEPHHHQHEHQEVPADVVVLVRSILLRGFDREMVDCVEKSLMSHPNMRIERETLPESITKLPSGKLLVLMSNGKSEEFDTVLVATGRYADTSGLNLSAVGVDVNYKNGKIICNHEQTSAPHVYAIGDVVEGAPELTPAAILAGKLLARRLFGNETEVMDYTKVPTTVFTPLEMGTVGLTEEAAIEQYGEDDVDCYISEFNPLEWSICEENHTNVPCKFKIVFQVSTDKVLGLHIAAPNSGEIMQGFAVAFRKGITFQDLALTVGIHPTVAEEFTVMHVKKSSGLNTAKKGC